MPRLCCDLRWELSLFCDHQKIYPFGTDMNHKLVMEDSHFWCGTWLQLIQVAMQNLCLKCNDQVQLNFLFIFERTDRLILYIADLHTGYSGTVIVPSICISLVSNLISFRLTGMGLQEWILATQKSSKASSWNAPAIYMQRLSQFDHAATKKIGVVGPKNAVVRLLIHRLLKDVTFFKSSESIDRVALLSRATYLSNILFGNKILSSFELAMGYTPAFIGLPKMSTSSELFQAHHEQNARRAISRLESDHNPTNIDRSELSRGRPISNSKCGMKCSKFEVGYILFVIISSSAHHRGKPIKAAHEDIRLQPTVSLLKELDALDTSYPLTYSFVEENLEFQEYDPTPPLPLLPEKALINFKARSRAPPVPCSSQIVHTEQDGIRHISLSDLDLAAADDVARQFEQGNSIWTSHPSNRSFLSPEDIFDHPSYDISHHAALLSLGSSSYPILPKRTQVKFHLAHPQTCHTCSPRPS